MIPSFHCCAHGERCIRCYHPGVNIGSGTTEGEVSERIWAQTNMFGITTKEMVASNRRIVYEDAFLHLFKQSQQQVVKVLQSKRIEVKSKLQHMEKERILWSQTDEDLNQMTKEYQNPSALVYFQIVNTKSEAKIHKIDSKIRNTRNEITYLYSILRKRHSTSNERTNLR